MKKSSNKQAGFILASELLLIVTILIIGSIVGLVTMRDAITAEMEDVSEAIGSLDQTYEFSGITNPQTTALIEGSAFGDADDALIDDNHFTFTDPSDAEGTAGVAASVGGTTDSVGTVTP